jgi:hypothetical protein
MERWLQHLGRVFAEPRRKATDRRGSGRHLGFAGCAYQVGPLRVGAPQQLTPDLLPDHRNIHLSPSCHEARIESAFCGWKPAAGRQIGASRYNLDADIDILSCHIYYDWCVALAARSTSNTRQRHQEASEASTEEPRLAVPNGDRSGCLFPGRNS